LDGSVLVRHVLWAAEQGLVGHHSLRLRDGARELAGEVVLKSKLFNLGYEVTHLAIDGKTLELRMATE
jgi:hypothetical protein